MESIIGRKCNNIEEDFIIEEAIKDLPKYITLSGKCAPGESKFMQLRKPVAIRFRKFNQITDAQNYYLSEIELFYPFKNSDKIYSKGVQELIEFNEQ